MNGNNGINTLPVIIAIVFIFIQTEIPVGARVYSQVNRVGSNLVDEIRAAQSTLAVSNNIAGTVLDLRFADGDDSAAANEELAQA